MTSNSNKTIESVQDSAAGVVLHGYHRKLKTMKKKYFVLYDDCGKSQARLEYFDNEKKFKSKANPKRSITLNSCFNINRRLDTKLNYVITLSTKDGSFGIVMDTEEEMNKWLRAMLKLQSGQNIFSGPPRPYYEHVWQVIVQRKGLAEKKGILGSYHVCLSSKSVTLIRIGLERTNFGEARVPVIEFYLTSIRRCGDSKCYFYMEVGRHSVIGAGELWMETKEPLIAQNMHTMILNVMSSNADDPYGPMRKRSSSATETSKPVTILQRRQTHSGSKTLNSSPLSVGNRDRCDSLPSSRNRTASESGYNSFPNTSMPPSRTMSAISTVPNSIYNRHSHSPPINSNALSPSEGFSESDGSTLSIDETDSMKHSLTADESSGFVSRFYNSRSPGDVIPEENSDEFWCAENKKLNCNESASILEKLKNHAGVNVAVCINHAENRKELSSSSNINSETPESHYMDMFNSISPCETALCDTTLAGAECPCNNCTDSSGGNSRASSLAEEIVDGYVHMSSPQTSDYVDMEQSLKNRRQIFNLSMSSTRSIMPAASLLKDICFAEYPIEKINPRLLADEDEMSHLTDRPPRAYSVGSRMEHNNQKLRIEVITNSDQNNCRVRAFSVGSRAKVPKCDLQRNVLVTANASNSNNSNVNNSKSSIASLEATPESSVRGRKSSSAPLLIHKSQNSVDRMEDLMEIDFSKNSGSRPNTLSSQSAGASSCLINLPKGSHLRSSILSSSPGQNTIRNKLHDSFSEQFRADNGYLEMRPVIYSHSLGSCDESVDHLLIPNDSSVPDVQETRPQQPDLTHNKLKMDEWNKVETPEGYLEMSWNGNKDSNSSVTDQNSTTNKHLISELTNAKSRSSSALIDIKKSRSVAKMPSIAANQSLMNNRNNSKFSILQAQNQKCAPIVLAKSECIQRKHLLDNSHSPFTISEERIAGADQDTTIANKFKYLSIQFNKLSLRNIEDVSNVHVDLSTPDTDCYDYINYCKCISNEMASAKAVDKNEVIDSQFDVSNQCRGMKTTPITKREPLDAKIVKESKSISSNADDSVFDERNKFGRKSSSPKCTPTSPHSSSQHSHRLNNTNRQTKSTGYELLHICSDSSLQTRKNISRSSSDNSDSIFLHESTQCRPDSVNRDCLQLSSVSSSTATLSVSSLILPKNCDNRRQEPFLILKPVPISNNAYNDDNKQNTDSVSTAGQRHLLTNDLTTTLSFPVSKIIEQCQPSLNTDLELHYASLDLPISSTKNSNATMYGSLINPTRSSTSDETSTSLSPNSNSSQQSAFTYAKIDFNQCESKKLKCGTQNNL